MNEFYADFQPKVQQARDLLPQSRSRYLGDDDNGLPVSVIFNLKYGPSIAIGDKGRPGTAYYSAKIDPDMVATITLEEALSLVSNAKSSPNRHHVVPYDCNGTVYSITIKPPAKGRDTHYFEFQGIFYSVLDTIDVDNITSIDIDKCIETKRLKASSQLYDFQDFKVLNGTFGPYISVPNKISKAKPIFISINVKQYNITTLTKEECIEIITNSPKKYAYNANNASSASNADANITPKKEKTTKKKPSKKTVTSSESEEETTVSKKRRSTKSEIPDDTPIDSSVPKKRKTTKKPEI